MGRHATEMTPAEAVRELRAIETALLEDVRVRGHAQHDLLELTAGRVREVREFVERGLPARAVPPEAARCPLCYAAVQPGQRFCGAACSQRWECGERPTHLSQ